MAPHDWNHRIRKLDERQDVGAHVHVQLHLLEFRLGQLARLVQDVLGNRELAGIVQQRGGFYRLDVLIVTDAKRPRQSDRVRLDAPHVIVRHVVFGVDGHRERFHGREIEPIEIAEVPPGVLEAAERRPKRLMADGDERHDNDDRREADLLAQKDDTKGQRPRGEVANGEPEEMLTPDLQDRLSGFEADCHGHKSRVEREVHRRQARERTDDRRRRQTADPEWTGTGERKEDMTGRPDRERRCRGVERHPIPAVAFSP